MIIKSIAVAIAIFVLGTHSANYVPKHEFARAISGNSSYVKLLLFNFHNIDRTRKGLDMAIDLAQDITRDDDCTVHFQLYIWKSNEYKRTPIQFNADACKILDSKLFDTKNIFQTTGVTSCPIKKGTYEIRNISPTSEGWPNSIPDGRYKFQLVYIFRKVVALTIEWMTEIISTKRLYSAAQNNKKPSVDITKSSHHLLV